MTRRLAVVLFNLGGPDGPASVEPFLFNLFNDPAIIRLPTPLRWVLAKLIARRRAPVAREIYAKIGGGSPILANTEAQGRALEAALAERGFQARCFIAMRYWRPRAAEVARRVKAFAPETVLLLPLYPQFSTTTSESSLTEWRQAATAAGLDAPTKAVCCYPAEDGFVRAVANGVRGTLAELPAGTPVRVLFSAHGLPKRIVAAGDPYQWQVEQTAAAILARLDAPGLDTVVCYQSRVGPLEWIGPATDAEIRRAGAEKRSVIVVPIAFVSEHSETLVELDIEYRRLAQQAGVPAYRRVATVGAEPSFVAGLARLAEAALATSDAISGGAGGRLCPATFGRCPMGGHER